jgi:hypothetical protein
MSDRELVEKLGDLDLNDRVRLTTSDGATFEGPASPIDYVPEDSLRVEIRPANTSERYEISASWDDEWSELAVRHVDAADADSAWEDRGTVERVEVRGEDEWEWGTG